MTDLPPAQIIADRPALERLVDRLRDEPRIACDTESNSLHAYRGRTCLVQLSTPDGDWLVDTLAIDDISALSQLFANPAIEKVFHAAEYDLICLKRDFGFDVAPVFDTMAAARVCGYERIGLGNMLQDFFGIQHPKTHQTADWAKRPLTASLRRYAQMDTHHLLRLRDALHDELARDGKLDEAHEYFADVTAIEARPEVFDPDGFWSLCRPSALDPQQAAILRELYILRDELAQAADYPPVKLIGNKALLKIAAESPQNMKQLFGVGGLPKWLARRHGDEIIQAVSHGAECLLPPKPPKRQRIPQRVAERYAKLRDWRKRKAKARGVESDVILSRGSMWEIARRVPTSQADLAQIAGLGPWRRNEYGEDLLSLMRKNGRKPRR